MASPTRRIDAVADEECVLDVVRGLALEIGLGSAARTAGPAAHLERDLGLGSLERVELLLRLEKASGVRLHEDLLADAQTVQDLISGLSAARNLSPAPSRLQAATESPTRGPEFLLGSRVEGLAAAETLQEVLRARGRADASRAHLIFYEDEGEGPSLTFGELLEGAERVAVDLAQRGIGRGDSVALMLPTSREFFLTFAGIVLSGATPVPIYPPFRADRIEEYAERQSAILANAGARLLVTFREAAGVAALLKPLVPSLEGVVNAEALVNSRAAMPPGPRLLAHSDDLGLLQYTSGSTGHPKGVMLTHANLLANIRAIGEAVGLCDSDVGVTWLPLYHDMGLIGSWLLPLYFGRPMVVLSPLAFLARPARWLRAFHRYRGTMGAAPNFAYELAATKIPDDEIQGLDLSSWRAALNGAEPVLPATLDRFTARFAPCGFRREALLPVYGLAEASLGVAFPPVGRGPRIDYLDRAAFTQEGRAIPAPHSAAAEDPSVISFVSVGRPIPGHEVRIVNSQGEDVGERVEGQLWFRGPSSTQGYYRNEAATNALLPAGPEKGWVDSGDRAYFVDSEIYITGRVKDIIIHAGRNLYPHEIEDCVAAVPGVRKGCVVAFGAPDPVSGTERLVIVAESRSQDAASREKLAQAVVAQVTESQGLPPDVVEIVPPHSIPKTSSGKLRRETTKQRFLAGTLVSNTPPVWMQIARIFATSGARRLGQSLRRTLQAAYGMYALSVFVLLLLPTWLLVLISPSRKSASLFTMAGLRAYLKLVGLRVTVNGRENLDEGKPRLLVANHTSYADIIVLMAILGADCRFVAKAEVLSMPFFRTFLRKLGHFAFRRQDPRERLQQAEQIEEALRRGESILVFPEGTFTPQSGVRPFQLGAFKAALSAHRDIVPIALEGTRRVLRDGTRLPRLTSITVTICPPIPPPDGEMEWQQIAHVRDLARENIARFSHEPLL